MTIFDIFVGFLPELSSSTRDINKTVNDTVIFTLFIIFFSMTVYFLIMPSNYNYIVYLIGIFFLISFSYYQIKNKLNPLTMDEVKPTYFRIDTTLQAYTEVIHIKYRDLWYPTTFKSHLSHQSILTISFTGKESEVVSVSLNKCKLKNSYRFHLRDLVLGKVFKQVVRDARDDLWLIELRLWGFFKPRLIVITKLLNS